MGRFSYYARLSTSDKAIYRKSDAITSLAVPDAGALVPLVRDLEAALATGKRRGVAACTSALANALCTQFGVDRPKIHVRQVRPQTRGGELHGLYTFADEGAAPRLEVWMRTAEKGDVVRFRTFLRTLLHELVHHFDMTVLALGDSFHTEGFFRRESSLLRQLAGLPKKTGPRQMTLF